MELNKVYKCDMLEGLAKLPEKSVQLIIADPPYFGVKGDFDFVWHNFDDYLKDVEQWAKACKRVLADNGTLFWYGHAKKIAYSQVILDQYFNLENSLVWQKTDVQVLKNVGGYRCFAPVTERILMYSNEVGMTGLEAINADNTLFLSLKIYFDQWLKNSGLTLKEATQKIGASCSHWFGFSTRNKVQFMFPTKEKWEIMRRLYNDGKTYEALRKEYEALRRPFNNFSRLTDVMKFSQEAHITGQYDHETKKPETLTRALILTCTRKGDIVLVPFSGSGTECAMAAKEGRKFIGFDLEQKYVDMANKRTQKHLKQLNLFHAN